MDDGQQGSAAAWLDAAQPARVPVQHYPYYCCHGHHSLHYTTATPTHTHTHTHPPHPPHMHMAAQCKHKRRASGTLMGLTGRGRLSGSDAGRRRRSTPEVQLTSTACHPTTHAPIHPCFHPHLRICDPPHPAPQAHRVLVIVCRRLLPTCRRQGR